MGKSPVVERFVSTGDFVAGLGETDKARHLFKFTSKQSKILEAAGGVTQVIGYANNAIEENGGLRNTLNGFSNAGSNIKWLLKDATTADWLNFGTSASTIVTAIVINDLGGLGFSAINAVTGYDLSLTGQQVESGVQAYVNFFQIP